MSIRAPLAGILYLCQMRALPFLEKCAKNMYSLSLFWHYLLEYVCYILTLAFQYFIGDDMSMSKFEIGNVIISFPAGDALIFHNFFKYIGKHKVHRKCYSSFGMGFLWLC